ncbi:MAG: hypothetical protein WA253_04635 [Gammaproteobacteria bacterium]
MTTQSKQQHWQIHIKQWEESGLSQKAYCTQSGINLNSFTYWRGKLLSSTEQKSKAEFVRIKVAPDPINAVSIPQSIQIKLLTGHVVYIPTTLDINDVVKLIGLLGVPHA